MRIRCRPCLLRERGVVVQFFLLEDVMFSERGQTADGLVEAGVEIEQMLVDRQFHARCPPAEHAFAAGVAVSRVWLGASAFDFMTESPCAAVPRS